MRRMQLGALCLAICSLAGLVSCSAQKKVMREAATPSTGTDVCPTGNAFGFTLVSNAHLTTASDRAAASRLPKKYAVYEVDAGQLDAFMKEVKANDGGTIYLPVPAAGCKGFTMVNSGTMSKELAAKFPELISMKGQSPESARNTLRLDYDGKKLKVQINWDNETYYITPWIQGRKVMYLVSNAKDTSYERQPFE